MCPFLLLIMQFLFAVQDYLLTKRMLRGMLVNDPDQRLSLSTILQDTELRKMLENPSSGHWSDIM